MRVLSVVVTVALTAACGRDGVVTPVSPDPPAPPPVSEVGCARTSVGLTPLIEPGSYQGHPLGLYPGGQNQPPGDHLAAGLDLARGVEPLDASGQPSPAGRFALISIGMSNTTQEFSAFVPLAAADSSRHPRLAIVDGAQGGMTAADWQNPGCSCWSVLEVRLQNAGVSRQQVVAAWIKVADRQPSTGWPAHAQTLANETIVVLQRLKARFPNLRLAYLSSRIYAGYATTTLNPEPYAYESGFAMRWAIDEQLAGNPALRYTGDDAPAPWIAWGPYLWADGLRARSDGLTWACSDFQSDGTHPSPSGRQKVAERLLDFVRTDPTASEWYLQR
ncbi:MAG TPA: hypothetical protein VMM93_01340 [Vicinamibacterales bacterium]|nr:hypothetical protein [Vicinamibacterales bacterium]